MPRSATSQEPLASVTTKQAPIRRRSGGPDERTERIAYGLAGFFGVLAIWEVLVRTGILSPYYTSSPVEIGQLFLNEIQLPGFHHHLWTSFVEWGLGYVLACVVGITVGIAAGWNSHSERAVMPFLTILYAAPELAFIPLFILWFGIGVTFKIFLVFLAGVFFVAINTMNGVRRTEQRYMDVAQVYGAGRAKIFTATVLPGAVPYIMTGVRQAAGRALVGMVAAEFISANAGLGFYITLSGATFNTAGVVMGVAILALFGVTVGVLLGRVERYFDVWRT